MFNVTVDDKYGDQRTGVIPHYYPQGGWAQGPQCTGCALNSTYVNPDRVMNGTWHDSTWHHSGDEPRIISIDFIGTAVYVYHIIVNHPPQPVVTIFTNLTFLIDDIPMGNYTHHPNSQDPFVVYDVPVYANSNLSNTKHTLKIQSGGGPDDNVVLFDYIQYTAEASPDPASSLLNPHTGRLTSSLPSTTPSTRESTPTTPVFSSASRGSPGIIAGIAASVSLAAILGLLALLICHRARAKSHKLKTAEDARRLIAVGSQERHEPFALPATTLEVPQPSPVAAAQWSATPARPALLPSPPIPSPIPSRPPPRHRADVPVPALSVTGTEHSHRYEELRQELATLEDMVRGIQETARSRRLRTAAPTDGQPNAAPVQRYTTTQKVQLASIRSQMTRVRRLIQDERRLMEETLPRSQR